MECLDVTALGLASGARQSVAKRLPLAALELAGYAYAPTPALAPVELTLTRTRTGFLLELAFKTTLRGPCQRCLEEARVPLWIRAREYQADAPATEEERSEYLKDGLLDLDQWARDALILALPPKLLCRADCAGLCPSCGQDLNARPHTHAESSGDPRWAPLAGLQVE